MPDFLFRWIKAIILFLNTLLGNIPFIRYLKELVSGANKTPQIITLFPIAFFIAVAVVLWLIFVTRLFSPEKKKPLIIRNKK